MSWGGISVGMSLFLDERLDGRGGTGCGAGCDIEGREAVVFSVLIGSAGLVGDGDVGETSGAVVG